MRISLVLVSLFYASICFSQNYKLWYEAPASEWTDALPIGNGRLGAMIFGDPHKDHIQFNEETLWTDGPRSHNLKGAVQYLPQIRLLLAAGKQKEAEELAQEHFMGARRDPGVNDIWLENVLTQKIPEGDPTKTDFNDESWRMLKVPIYHGWETQGLEGLDGAV